MPVNRTTDDIYPNRWIKVEDIPDDADLVLTIVDVNEDSPGMDNVVKLVCSFRETSKLLALNVTNARTIEQLYGKDPNAWIGKRIALFKTEGQYAGKVMWVIRVRMRPPAEPPRREPGQILPELGY